LSLVNHKNVKFKTISLNVQGILCFFLEKTEVSKEVENQWQKYLCNPNLKFITQQNTSPLFQLRLHVIEHKYKKLLPLRRCTTIHPNPKTKTFRHSETIRGGKSKNPILSIVGKFHGISNASILFEWTKKKFEP